MGLLRSLSVGTGTAMEKAARLFSRITDRPVPTGHRQTAAIEASWMQEAIRYKDKPWGLTYDILRTLSIRDSVIAAIHVTRIRQVSSFWKPAAVTHDGKGFAIRHRDAKHVLTPVERHLIARNERFIEECGNTDTPRPRFNQFLKMVVRDRLTFDQVCHPPGTRVLMADGSAKAIEDVIPGDAVWTHAGRVRRVTEVFRRPYRGLLYGIKARRGGETLWATHSHPLLIARQDWFRMACARGTHAQPVWHAASNVRTGDYVTTPRLRVPAEKAVLDLHALLPHLAHDDVHVWAPHSHNHAPARGDLVRAADVAAVAGVHPDTATAILGGYYQRDPNGQAAKRVHAAAASLGWVAPTPLKFPRQLHVDSELAAFFGLYVAEGHVQGVTTRLTFRPEETAFSELISAIARRFDLNVTLVDYAERDAVTQLLSSTVLAELLTLLFGTGSAKKRLPAWMLYLPRAEKCAFLRSYIDGDGHRSVDGYTVGTVSETLAHQVFTLLLTMGYRAGVRCSRTAARQYGWSPIWQVQIGGRQAVALSEELSDGSYTAAHRDCLQDAFYYYSAVSATTQLAYAGDVYNLEVEEDHSYVAETFISHNCVERVFDRAGRLAELHPVDAATVRIRYDTDQRERNGYIQLLDGREYVELEPEQVIFAVDNPRADLRVGGYGMSEIELIVNIITSHLFAEDVNKRRIQPGIQLDGLLWAEGAEMTFEMLEGLRRAWQAQAQGVIGTGHIAAVNLPHGTKLNYIPLHKQLNDMEWSRWIDYMINIAAACFAIDPSELNFPNRGGPAQTTPLFETGHEARLIYSKDKGLRALLSFLEEMLTEGVVWMLEGGQDFMLEFRGVDARTREQESEVATRETATYMTINEYRQSRDMPTLDGGDIIRDPSFMQERQQVAAQQQQMAALGAASPGAPAGLSAEAGAAGETGTPEGGAAEPATELPDVSALLAQLGP